MAQQVKNPPAIQEMLELGVWSLEKEMATHFSILTWKIPGTEEPGGLQSMGLQIVGHDWTCKHSTEVITLHRIDVVS